MLSPFSNLGAIARHDINLSIASLSCHLFLLAIVDLKQSYAYYLLDINAERTGNVECEPGVGMKREIKSQEVSQELPAVPTGMSSHYRRINALTVWSIAVVSYTPNVDFEVCIQLI